MSLRPRPSSAAAADDAPLGGHVFNEEEKEAAGPSSAAAADDAALGDHVLNEEEEGIDDPAAKAALLRHFYEEMGEDLSDLGDGFPWEHESYQLVVHEDGQWFESQEELEGIMEANMSINDQEEPEEDEIPQQVIELEDILKVRPCWCCVKSSLADTSHAAAPAA